MENKFKELKVEKTEVADVFLQQFASKHWLKKLTEIG